MRLRRSSEVAHARVRRALGRAGWGLGLGLSAVAAVRASGSERQRYLIGVQGVARWLMLPALPLAAVAGWCRRPALAALLAGLGAYGAVLTRSAGGAGRPDRDSVAPGSRIRLVTANLLLNNPCVIELGRQLAGADADVVCLQELTPEHLAGLRRSGLLKALPYAVTDERPGFHGSALLSRWSLTDTEVLDLAGHPCVAATVLTPDGPVRVVSVHALNPGAPVPGHRQGWQRQLRQLGRLVRDSPLPVVLAGDFNATADHRSFRRLLDRGLRDAFSVAGRGGGASWPVWRSPMVPLMRLDHVLVTPGTAVLAADTARSPGSDHRQLRVELALRPT